MVQRLKSKASEALRKAIQDVVISEYAMSLGVSRAVVYDWANGKNRPNDKHKAMIEKRHPSIKQEWWYRDA